MSRLSERLARRPRLTGQEPAPPASDEQVTIGIQPRDLGLAAVEARHEAAHQAWLDALRASRSGRNRDLARLAVTQKAYEEMSAELERARVEDARQQQRLGAVRRRHEEAQRRADAIARQTVAWKRIHELKARRPRGLLDRLLRRP